MLSLGNIHIPCITHPKDDPSKRVETLKSQLENHSTMLQHHSTVDSESESVRKRIISHVARY